MKNEKQENAALLSKIPGGARTKDIVIPLAITLILIHLVVITMIVLSTKHSVAINSTLTRYSEYTTEVNEFSNGTMVLSETSSAYIMTPTRNGAVNYGPMISYATEFTENHRGADIIKSFKNYDVGDEIKASLEVAASAANEMIMTQLHAVALMRDVYPLPSMPVYNNIPEYELTLEEKQMSDEEKVGLAKNLIFGGDYSKTKGNFNESINECIDKLRIEMNKICEKETSSLSTTRMTLWIVTTTSILVLIATFIMFFKLMFVPLGKDVRKIAANKELDDTKGIYEVRLLATAYNDLKNRRDLLEEALREAAENDALTKLPNRYKFNHALAKQNEKGYSVAIFLFDINYLKQTNDTLGHLAGDALICRSADCIVECFGDETGSNCYRFGGDEFSAIVKNITPEEIEYKIKKFSESQKKNDVSIAMGYEYTKDVGKTTLRNLFLEADRKMYANKSIMHDEKNAL